MKIAILGTRGIPNNYGGFEQFAEILSIGLVKRGHQVTVYNPHFYPCETSDFHGVEIRYAYSPEKYIGAAANFIYDFLSLQDVLRDEFDIVLECGYHSNAVSYYLMKDRRTPVLITNMDGLEWKRSKWNAATRWLIKKLEKIAVKKSHYLVSDNKAIQAYYKNTFGVNSFFIAYGADTVDSFDKDSLNAYALKVGDYYLLVARLEPENNIEMILDGYIQSDSDLPFIVVGNHATKYGDKLKEKYKNTTISFVGGIYEKKTLDAIRHYAKAYFHGHSVGGTNPSLLEAMACQVLIVSYDSEFNRAVLGHNALYFSEANDVTSLINGGFNQLLSNNEMIRLNTNLLNEDYSWEKIIDAYESLFLSLLPK